MTAGNVTHDGGGTLLLESVDATGRVPSHLLRALRVRRVAAVAVGPDAVDLSDGGLQERLID